MRRGLRVVTQTAIGSAFAGAIAFAWVLSKIADVVERIIGEERPTPP